MHLCGSDGPLTGTEPSLSSPGDLAMAPLKGLPCPLSLCTQDPLEQQQQLKRRQKNRAAAQRSRQKHTDRADALHQQHESLEKDNQALRKEIQALQDELAWWSRTLQVHESLCPLGRTPGPAPEPPSCCWGPAKRPPDPRPTAPPEQPGLLLPPAPALPAQQLSPDPQPRRAPGLLPAPPPSVPLGPTAATTPAAQLPPSSVHLATPPGSGLLRPFSKLNPLPCSPPAQPAPSQPLGPEHPTSRKLGTWLRGPPGPQAQPGHCKSPDLPGLEPSPHPLLAFPLLASAQVHF